LARYAALSFGRKGGLAAGESGEFRESLLTAFNFETFDFLLVTAKTDSPDSRNSPTFSTHQVRAFW
jgi:hypothetical protein